MCEEDIDEDLDEILQSEDHESKVSVEIKQRISKENTSIKSLKCYTISSKEICMKLIFVWNFMLKMQSSIH
jgi:hypothetical protein